MSATCGPTRASPAASSACCSDWREVAGKGERHQPAVTVAIRPELAEAQYLAAGDPLQRRAGIGGDDDAG